MAQKSYLQKVAKTSSCKTQFLISTLSRLKASGPGVATTSHPPSLSVAKERATPVVMATATIAPRCALPRALVLDCNSRVPMRIPRKHARSIASLTLSLPSIPPRHVFGAKGDVADNVTYVDETTVAYVAGHQLVLYHVETKTQRFIPGRADTEAITALAFSQCKSYVAVAERAEKGVITVYDLTTTTGSPRKRVLEGDVGSKVRLVSLTKNNPNDRPN